MWQRQFGISLSTMTRLCLHHLFSMHPDKCLGPKGYDLGFYKHLGSSCSEDIFKDCCVWLDIGQFPTSLNSSNIALIPKGNSQTTMKDCILLPMCNVLYKIIFKVIANKCKVFLPKCIFDTQFTYVSGRSILDNAMMAIEVNHYMKTKMTGNGGSMRLS